jgi:hypothetical protein
MFVVCLLPIPFLLPAMCCIFLGVLSLYFRFILLFWSVAGLFGTVCWEVLVFRWFARSLRNVFCFAREPCRVLSQLCTY